jgi:hypothetical protein
MLKERCLAGNLYALSRAFVERIRAENVRIPLGWIIEDGMVGALAKWDLDPMRGWDDRFLVPCPEAGFRFDSLRMSNPRHWRVYWNRRLRYSTGYFQNRVIAPFLKRSGLKGIPQNVEELWRCTGLVWPKPRGGLDAFFDRVARVRIERRSAVRRDQSTT